MWNQAGIQYDQKMIALEQMYFLSYLHAVLLEFNYSMKFCVFVERGLKNNETVC